MFLASHPIANLLYEIGTAKDIAFEQQAFAINPMLLQGFDLQQPLRQLRVEWALSAAGNLWWGQVFR